jgi:outer membrane protein assembly factor BamB
MVTLLLAVLALGQDGSWPQWRGPKRDGISFESGLLAAWPEGGPALAWKIGGLGGGWSSVSVHGGRIYTLGDAGGACTLFALQERDGKVLWSVRVGEAGGHNRYPGSRSTPSTDGDVVVALGQHGDLVAVAAADGKERWRVNLEGGLGGRMMSGWRWSESPLIDGAKLICTPGGSKGTLAALDLATGRVLWRTPDLTEAATYGAPVPAEIGGVKQYLVRTPGLVAGVSAADGKLLWKAERKGGERATVSEPLHADGTVFASSGYNVGCDVFQVTESGGAFSAKELYSGRQLRNHHGGMVLIGGYVYGVDDGGSLKCLELKTGRETWSVPGLGKGAVAVADGRLYYRSENAGRPVVALFEISPTAGKEVGRFVQPEPSGKQTWAHPVIAGGRLYLRDQDALFAYTVKAP